jgi:hypothetical protein
LTIFAVLGRERWQLGEWSFIGSENLPKLSAGNVKKYIEEER